MITRIDLENVLKQALSSGVNLFLGAGFSILAKSKDGRQLPIGQQLQEELAAEFMPNSDVSGLSLAQICTILENTANSELKSYLRGRFSVGEYDPRYAVLNRLNINSVFTTNVDDLLYRVFEASTRYYINDVMLHGPSRNDRNAIDLVPLHGSVVQGEDSLTFSTLGIATSFNLDPAKWHLLTAQLQKKPIIFWGYSLSDAGVLQSISRTAINQREHKDKWIVLRENDAPSIAYFQALGFHIIIGGTNDILDYIDGLNLVTDIPDPNLPHTTTRQIFPNESIPEIGSPTVPSRPLTEFFKGGAPYWDDIFNNRLHKTNHYHQIIDSISSGRHTIVHGQPATGKSTLLLQTANDIQFNGHKLICDLISLEKAQFIIRELRARSERALVFVDNFADDIDAFSALAAEGNIQVVGFDRTPRLDWIPRRLDSSYFNYLDVTDLTPSDIQAIYLNIPLGIRRMKYKKPRMHRGTPPSMFEIIETNTVHPSLGTRFRSLLESLATDQDIHDLLIMIAYVHSCRTPVSFDMAYAFLSGDILRYDYNNVFEILDRLGSLIVDYGEDLIDGDQDYYVPRSAIVANAILNQVGQDEFKEVLMRFHKSVPAFLICKFDVFKREGYDKRHVTRAFGRWEEGKAFYEGVAANDESEYLLQQGALYLADKKRFSEAFSWIDQALSQTDYRNFSIRNSHAVIIFKANIDKEETEDGQVRRSLDDSMRILSECYRLDKGKAYHTETFARQALSYWDRFGDELAYEYLQRSLLWLREEHREPWRIKVIRELSSLIQSRLRLG